MLNYKHKINNNSVNATINLKNTYNEKRLRRHNIAVYDRDNLHIVKAPMCAGEFILDPVYAQEFIVSEQLPQYAIFHTRAATQGTKNNNVNNHPLYHSNGYSLIHNGILSNDKYISTKYKFDGQVDSEAILQVYANTEGDAKARINAVFDNISGSFACAVISQHDNNLVLFKHSNPIIYALDPDNGIFWFSSDKDYLESSILRYKENQKLFGFVITPIYTKSLEDNNYLIINENGLIESGKCEYTYANKGSNYSSRYDEGCYTSYTKAMRTYASLKDAKKNRKFNYRNLPPDYKWWSAEIFSDYLGYVYWNGEFYKDDKAYNELLRKEYGIYNDNQLKFFQEKVKDEVTCIVCQGTGYSYYDPSEECHSCHGSGYVKKVEDTCVACKGTGKNTKGENCPICTDDDYDDEIISFFCESCGTEVNIDLSNEPDNVRDKAKEDVQLKWGYCIRCIEDNFKNDLEDFITDYVEYEGIMNGEEEEDRYYE